MEAEELKKTHTSSRRGCLLEARGITYDVIEDGGKRRRRILDDVSVAARPSELLAVVGPSGAGKSTLLRFLSGRLPLPSPALRVDGRPLPSHSHLLHLVAFVPQHDRLHPLLTPRETLVFAAHLRRVPSSRADALLSELRIPASSAPVRSLSGGEKRRLSVAVEAVHDPPVLVLDEATSGLDSGSALQMVEMLRAMAEGGGKTVVVSVHQPGSRMVKAFGAVAVMAAGKVVHHGSVEGLLRMLTRAGIGIPMHVNAVELAMEHLDTLSKVADDEDDEGGGKKKRRRKKKKGDMGRRTLGKLFEGEEEEEIVKGGGRGGVGNGGGNLWVVETSILTHRNLKIILRTKELFLCRTIQMLISGLVLGSIFYHLPTGIAGAKERVGLFAFTLTFLLSTTTEALPIFLEERQIILKETSSGTYRISAYAAAGALAFLPFLLILALLFSIPVYWLVGLNATLSSFSYFTLLIWLILYTANSVVSCFASIAPDFIVGNSLISGVLGAFFLFSGYFIRKEEMPSYWVFMHYLSLFKYPLEGFLVNEFSDKCLEEKGGVCEWRGGDVLRGVGLGEESKWRNVGIMFGLILLYRVLGYVFLRCRCSYEWGAAGLWRVVGR